MGDVQRDCTEWRMSNSPTSIIATSVTSHQTAAAVTAYKRQCCVTFHFQMPVNERCWHNIKSKIRYKAGNQKIQPRPSPICCVTDSLHDVISRPECLWLLCSYYLPLCTWWAIRDPSWVRLSAFSLEKKKKTYSDRPLILRLSSNVRWWSASRSGWGMLSRTALEDFTSWSSRSQRFSDVRGKITSTSNLPSLRPGNYAAVTSNQLNLPFFICVIKVISAWNNHIKRAPCRRAKFNLWLLSDNFLMKAISLIFLHLRAPAERQETGEEVGLRGMPTKGGQH